MILLDCIAQRLTARALGDPPVEFFVQIQVEKTIPVSLVRKSIDARSQPLQLGSLLRRRNLSKESRRLDLQRLANHIEPAYVLLARNSHPRSGSRSTFEQALELQPKQRLRDRQQAHPEFAGEFAARDHLTNGQFASQYPLAQDLVCFRGQTDRLLSVVHLLTSVRGSVAAAALSHKG